MIVNIGREGWLVLPAAGDPFVCHHTRGPHETKCTERTSKDTHDELVEVSASLRETLRAVDAALRRLR
jgi:hypothetical protein